MFKNNVFTLDIFFLVSENIIHIFILIHNRYNNTYLNVYYNKKNLYT